jgi:dynein heavy chain, axonemal
VRNKFVASAFVRVNQHALIVGGVGVGKTMIANSVLEGLPAEKASMTINFSAQTSSNSLQVRAMLLLLLIQIRTQPQQCNV